MVINMSLKASNSKGKAKFTVTTSADLKSKRAEAVRVAPQRQRALEADSIDGSGDEDVTDEEGTGDEIEVAMAEHGKSKKTAKRKRRATSPTSFGVTLQSLLGAELIQSSDDADEIEEKAQSVPSDRKAKKARATSTANPILSMAPHYARAASSTTLNARAARIALEVKRAREERAHVTDVIGGWGRPGEIGGVPPPEGQSGNVDEWLLEGGSQGYERRLRKVAQRGVVKLFNAIRAAQSTTTDDLEKVLPPTVAKGLALDVVKGESLKSAAPAGKKAPNALGGKEAALADLSKNNFLDLLRAGVGKAART